MVSPNHCRTLASLSTAGLGQLAGGNSRLRRLAFALALSLICVERGVAGAPALEESPYVSRLWSMEEGLPHNIVQAIIQTQDGYLWVGTREGLGRFDGIKFQILELLPGQGRPSVTSLIESRDHGLWAGTETHGLFLIRDGVAQRCQLPDGTTDFKVYKILEGGDASIWLETPKAIFRWSAGKFEQRLTFPNELQAIQPLCRDDQGHVWLANHELTSLDAPAVGGAAVKTGLLASATRSLYWDKPGDFLVGSINGLVRLQDGVATSFRKAEGPAGIVSVIFRDHADRLWIGSYAGLSWFENGEFHPLRPDDEPAYRIYAVLEDREKNLWIGSEEGLTLLAPKKFKVLTRKDGLGGNTVVTVCTTKGGDIWMSSWGNGLNRLADENIKRLGRADGLASDYIMAMTGCRDGSLWAASIWANEAHDNALNHLEGGHITVYGREQGFVAGANTAPTALLEDRRGVIWIGLRDALQCWDGKQFTVATNLAGKKINALVNGRAGAVWIGTEQGLLRWHEGRFENLAASLPALHVAVLSLYLDAQDTLWIGTRDNGLLRWRDGKVLPITVQNGLASDSIYAVLEDNHSRLWLSGSRGIFWIDKAAVENFAAGKKSSVVSVRYNKNDGLLISGQYGEVTQPAACQSADGRLWFRTTQGVAIVDPEKIAINPRPPAVMIQEIMTDGVNIYDSLWAAGSVKKIVIPPGRGDLEIHYAALSYCAPERNQFRYRLEGVNATWVDAGTRNAAYYGSLAPGQRRFEVIACNNDGIWNTVGASILLELQPHFWQMLWFKIAVGTGLAGIIAGTTRMIAQHRYRQKLRVLEQQNAIEKERTRIARDMHDELGAKLTQISFQGSQARRCLSNPLEAEKQIIRMSESAREMIHSLDQIVWTVDPQNDSLDSLVTYLCRFACEFFEGTSVQCELVVPTEVPQCRLVMGVRHNVFLAVKEILNNAFKHSGATRIVFQIVIETESFGIRITDNGSGISPAPPDPQGKPRREGNGLSNLRRRMAAIVGSCEMNSKPGQGTEVCLMIPLPPKDRDESAIPPRTF